MRESYRLCQRPELLYNLAMLQRELNQCRPALDDYSSYLQHVPQGRYWQAAEQAIIELSRECPAPLPPASGAPPPAAPAPTAKSEPPAAPDLSKNAVSHPDSPYWTAPRIIGWSAVTAGVLAGVGALYFRVAAGAARSDFQGNVDRAVAGTESLDLALRDEQHRDQRIAQVMAISGGALVAGGALVLIFDSKDQARAAAAQVQAHLGWLEVCYTQRF